MNMASICQGDYHEPDVVGKTELIVLELNKSKMIYLIFFLNKTTAKGGMHTAVTQNSH